MKLPIDITGASCSAEGDAGGAPFLIWQFADTSERAAAPIPLLRSNRRDKITLNSDENRETRGRERRIADLREAILRWFPAERYTGKVTEFDGEWLPELTEEKAILDDDKALYEALHGRRWTEVPKEIIQSQPDGYVLLTDEAFRAFIAAWLMNSLDNMDGENEVREFFVYSLTPQPERVPDLTLFKANRVRVLNRQQTLIVRSILSQFAQSEHSEFLRRLADRGVNFIDQLEVEEPPTG